MSVRRPSPSGDAPPLLALSQPSRRLDEVLRAGQAHREASVGALFDKRARVQDSHTALENAQRHAREQQENVQRLNEQLLLAQEREQACREEAEFDKRELERARGSLRLRLQKLQKQLADRNALSSAQVEELGRDLARAQSELAERDIAIVDYSAQVDAANEAQAALQKELDDLRRVIESVPRGTEEAEEPEWIREATDVLNATAPLQDSVDALTQENSMLQSRLDELRRTQSLDRDVCEGLRAQIEGLRETFSAQLSRSGAGQPGQDSQAPCTNASYNPEQYNTDLFMAVAQGRVRDVLRLINNGARLDSDVVFKDTAKHYTSSLGDVAASLVLFEDFNWLGARPSAFSRLILGSAQQWQYSINESQHPWRSNLFRKGGDSHDGGFSFHWFQSKSEFVRWYMQPDKRDEEGMLQIVDILAENQCTGTGFRFWMPTMADPTNWTLPLVQRAYERGMMPQATEWSLLNAILLWISNSPLVMRCIIVDSEKSDNFYQKKKVERLPWLFELSPQAVIQHEKALVAKLRGVWQFAQAIGQSTIERKARNNPFYFFRQQESRKVDEGHRMFFSTEWRPSSTFPDPNVFLPTPTKPSVYEAHTFYHFRYGNELRKRYYYLHEDFKDLYEEALTALQMRRELVLEIEESLGFTSEPVVKKWRWGQASALD